MLSEYMSDYCTNDNEPYYLERDCMAAMQEYAEVYLAAYIKWRDEKYIHRGQEYTERDNNLIFYDRFTETELIELFNQKQKEK